MGSVFKYVLENTVVIFGAEGELSGKVHPEPVNACRMDVKTSCTFCPFVSKLTLAESKLCKIGKIVSSWVASLIQAAEGVAPWLLHAEDIWRPLFSS
jgi:hypothetical protein